MQGRVEWQTNILKCDDKMCTSLRYSTVWTRWRHFLPHKEDKTPILKFLRKIRNYDSTSDCLAVIYVTSCPVNLKDNTKHSGVTG